MLCQLSNPLVRRVIGIVSILLISILMSDNKSKIVWKNIFLIFGSIWFFAYILVNSSLGISFVSSVAYGFEWLYSAGMEGVRFVFGSLALESGPVGFIFAFRVLPMIIFFSALTGVLYYFHVIQWFVRVIGVILRPLYGTTGPESMCAIANGFLSQSEAPLLIKTYLRSMTESEIFVVMVSGMSTISSSLFAVYGVLGVSVSSLLVSSILSIPASLCVSKLIIPPTGKEKKYDIDPKGSSRENFFSVLSEWTGNGLNIALHVGAFLIVIISLLYSLNFILSYIGDFFFYKNFSLEKVFSYIMWPAAWAMGISRADIGGVASLLGTKVAINEMISYLSLVKMNMATNATLYATYALCGFSNFSSVGIQIGSIGAMEPEVKPMIAKLGLRAVFAAVLVNLLVSYIIGFFI